MITRLAVSTVVGGIVMFALGFLIYGLALQSFMQANSNQFAGLMKVPPNFILLIGGNLVFGLLLSVIAECWANARDFSAGLKVGAIVAFLVAAWANLMFESMMDLYKGVVPMIVDVVATTFMGAITGGAIGFVRGKMGAKDAA